MLAARPLSPFQHRASGIWHYLPETSPNLARTSNSDSELRTPHSALRTRKMSEPLIAPTFLFRFSVPCQYQEQLWTDGGVQLPESCRLPSFGELEERPLFADVRAGWNETGLAFTVRVESKKQLPWCRDSRLDDSDGLQVWIDTRNMQTVHRAGRFCHRFVFLPGGNGPKLEQPFADQLLIHRARENARPIRPDQLGVRSEKRVDGYILEGFLPAEVLTGFEPADHQAIGFTYAVLDRELGWQTFTVGSEFRFQEDPSLWGTLELVRG